MASRLAGPTAAVAVKVMGEPCSPAEVAVAVWAPDAAPSVQVTSVVPSARVTDDDAKLAAMFAH
jgi:hypothetical protein